MLLRKDSVLPSLDCTMNSPLTLSLTKTDLELEGYTLQKEECPNFGVILVNRSVLKRIPVDPGSLNSNSVIRLR